MPIDLALVVSKRLQRLEEAQPCAVPFPAGKAVVASAPRPVSLGDVTPRGTELDAPEDSIDDTAVVSVGVATLWVGGEVWLKRAPLCVTQVSAVRQIAKLPSRREISRTDLRSRRQEQYKPS